MDVRFGKRWFAGGCSPIPFLRPALFAARLLPASEPFLSGFGAASGPAVSRPALRPGRGGFPGLLPRGDVDPEAGAFACHGIDADRAAQLFGDRLADRKPESGPLGECVEFDETFEDAFPVFGRDADARVADVEANVAGNPSESDRHRSFSGKFQRVARKVVQHLGKPLPVLRDEEFRQPFLDAQFHARPALEAERVGDFPA